MIDLTSVIELSTQMDVLSDQINASMKPFMAIFLFSIVGGLVGGIMGVLSGDKRLLPLFAIMLIPFIIIAVGYDDHKQMVDERLELKEQRDLEYFDIMNNAECDDLRLHLVDVLENEYPDFIEDDFDRLDKLYYPKCEVPLRVEIVNETP